MLVRPPNPGLPWVRVTVAGCAATALVGAVALMATPAAVDGGADERTALAVLREIARAQREFVAEGRLDTDGDGQGEFGFLGELTGGSRLRIDALGRLGTAVLAEPQLPIELAELHDGANDNGSYLFAVCLPGTDGQWVAEADQGGGAGIAVDPDAAEQQFRAFAWPLDGAAGCRAFGIDASGRLVAHDNRDRRYSGRAQRVPAEALDEPAAGAAAQWQPVN